MKLGLWACGITAALGVNAARAQDSTAAAPTQLDTVVVTDTADYFRNRSQDIAPRLVYENEFFDRFEPLSVGDMLKQVPGVAFTSDIGEYDAPQLRGIGTEYTQILINGSRVAGAGEDRGVFVDRIPAELVERIEIIRSPSAELDSQGVAGSINIVLKDASDYAGGQFRLGSFTAGDDTTRGAGFLSYGGQRGRLSYLASANLQQRYNPKDKRFATVDAAGTPVEEGQEDDVRDTTDTAFNGRLGYLLPWGASVGLEGFYVGTDRDEDQVTTIFEFEENDEGLLVPELDGVEYEHERIDEVTIGAAAQYLGKHGPGEVKARVELNQLDLDIENQTGDLDEQDGELPTEFEDIDTQDDELRLLLSYAWSITPAHKLTFGVQASQKDRDSSTTAREEECEEDDTGEETCEFEDATAVNGVYQITEDRIDVFAQHIWSITPRHALELGLRSENAQLEQEGFSAVEEVFVTAEDDQSELNPSLHYRFKVTDNDQLRASYARTLRRPLFSDLVPFIEEDDGEFFAGNPKLEPEAADGLDFGFEHRFARQAGVVGVNVFYRDVQDVIELTEFQTAAGEVTQPANVGDGQVHGLELDASLPLVGIGLPSTNLYGNYTYLDSRIDDPTTGEERRFNLQPRFVFNLGFNHKIKAYKLTFGASFQGQGESFEYASDEINRSRYDGNLEAFVEYQILENLAIKLNGNNLLDSELKERILKYDDGRADGGVVTEIENERESVGEILIVTLRGTF